MTTWIVLWLDGMTTVNTLTCTYDAVGILLTADDDLSSYDFECDNLHRLIESGDGDTTGVPNVVHEYDGT